MYKLIYFKLFVSAIARTYMDRAIYINEVKLILTTSVEFDANTSAKKK